MGKALVALIHEATEGRQILALQGGTGGDNPQVLLDHVAAAAVDDGFELRTMGVQHFQTRIAKTVDIRGMFSQQRHARLTLAPALIVGALGQGTLNLGIAEKDRRAAGEGHKLEGEILAVQHHYVILLAHQARHLVHYAALDAHEAVLSRLAQFRHGEAIQTQAKQFV